MTATGDNKQQLQQRYDHQGRPNSVPVGRTGLDMDSGLTADLDGDSSHPPPYSVPATAAHEEALERQVGTAEATAAQRRGAVRQMGIPTLDYGLYTPAQFALSEDKTTIKSKAVHLSTSAEALAALVRASATVPPKPMLEVRGRQQHTGGEDFLLRLNLMPLLVAEDARRRMNYVRCVGHGELALRGGSGNKPSTEPDIGDTNGGGDDVDPVDAWCQRFVADTAPVKVFVLERQVANLDREWLEDRVRRLVKNTGYDGEVEISFPVTHTRVVVQNPDRVNPFLTSVAALFAGKSRYEVVKAVWPFATHKPGDSGRKFAVQSEEAWWEEWRDIIRLAVVSRRKGWVSIEDKLEWLMEGG